MKKSICFLSSLTLLSCQQQDTLDPIAGFQKIKSKVNPTKQISKDSISVHNVSMSKRRKSYITKCLQDEVQYQEIEQSLIEPIAKSFLNRSDLSQKISKVFSTNIEGKQEANLLMKKDGIKISKVKLESKETLSTGNLHEQLLSLLNVNKIDYAKIDTIKFKVSPGKRRDSDLSYDELLLDANIDLRGTGTEGRTQSMAQATMKVLKEAGQWKLSTFNLQNMTIVTSKRKPAFSEVTAMSEIGKTPTYLRSEAIRRGGYALSAADTNADGKGDLIVGSKEGLLLYHGDGKGNFNLVKDSGFRESESYIKAALTFDYDNDSNQDLVLTKFNFGKKNQSDVIIYRGLENGKFEYSPKLVKKILPTDYAMPASIADFNNDGLLDFYVGFPGERDFTVLNEVSVSDKVTSPHGLFLNTGDKGKNGYFFEDKTTEFKMVEDYPGFTRMFFPHSSLAVDFDRDSDMDIIVIDDRMNISPVYRNEDLKKFTNVASPISLENKGYGMGIAAGDIDNDGDIDFAVTNVNFTASTRLETSCAIHWDMKDRPFGDTEGLRLFLNNGDNTFSEKTKELGLSWAGEGVAGVEFVDYNNDGLLDIYVANGLWSATKDEKKHDLSSIFARANLLRIAKPDELMARNAYNSSFLDFLKFNEGEKPSMAGFQRNRLFINTGKTGFYDVGYIEGVDSIADGYVIAKSDFNLDGKMDLVLRNGDPGVSVDQFPAVQIFKNDFQSSNSVVLKLEGTESNRDAIGAEVVAHMKDKRIVRQLIGNNGAAQSMKLVHIGLGDYKQIDKMEIRWPSSVKTIHQNIKAGYYNIKETNSHKKVSKIQ